MTDLTLSLGIDAGGAQQGSQTYVRSLEDIRAKSDQGVKSIKKVEGAFESMKASAFDLKGALGTLAGAFSLGAIAHFTKGVIDSTDALNDMSKKTGVAVESLQAFAYIAKLNGTSVDAFATGLKFLNNNLAEASAGSKTAEKAFSQLGLSTKELSALNADEQFIKVAGAIDNLASSADKTKASMDIFGRSGTDLIPVMEGGADAIRGMIKEANNLGLVIGQDQVDKIARFNDAWDTMTLKLQALARDGFLWLHDHVIEFEKGLAAAMVEGAGAILKFGNTSQSIVSAIADGFSAAFDTIGNIFSSFTADLANFAADPFGGTSFSNLQKSLEVGIVDSFRNAFNATIDEADKFNQRVDDSVTDKLLKIGKIGVEAHEKLQNATKGTARLTKELSEEAQNLKKKLEEMADDAEVEMRALQEGLTPSEEKMMKFEAFIERDKKNFKELGEAGEALKKRIEDAFDQTASLEKQKKNAEALSKPFIQAAENIQNAFADSFYDILENGKFSFKKLGDSLKSIMFRTIAEITAAMVFRPIIAPIVTNTVGALFGQMAGNITGQQLGVGTGSNLSSLGSIGSAAYNYGSGTSIFGGTGYSAFGGLTPAINQFGYNYLGTGFGSGLTSGSMTTSSLSGVLGSAGIGAAIGSLGTKIWGGNQTGSTVGGTLGGAAGGYLAGTSAGIAAGSALGVGGGAAAGAAGGAAAGATAGSVVPVVGTIIGAILGAVLGSMIGPKPGVVASEFSSITGGETTYGAKGASTKPAEAMAAMLGDFSGTLQQVSGLGLAYGTNIHGGFNSRRGGGFLEYNGKTENFDVNNAQSLTEAIAKMNIEMLTASSTMDDKLKKALQAIQIEGRSAADIILDIGVATGKATKDFNDSITLQIRQIKDAPGLALEALDKEFDVLREQAKRVGGDLTKVEELYGLKRSQILQAQVQELEKTRSQFEAFAKSLKDFRESLLLDNQLSILSPEQRLLQARSAFEDVSRRAQLGDLDAFNQLQGSSKSLLDASRAYNASGSGYVSDFNLVQGGLSSAEGVANRQVSAITSQISALTAPAVSGQAAATNPVVTSLDQYRQQSANETAALVATIDDLKKQNQELADNIKRFLSK